jgi:hypothetical protein
MTKRKPKIINKKKGVTYEIKPFILKEIKEIKKETEK